MGTVKPQKGIVTERWTWQRRHEVRMWLVNNFGTHGDRWGEQLDYGLENLYMDVDVYNWYILTWGDRDH
jgi:hypothetical protein